MSGGNLIFPKGKENMLNGKINLDRAADGATLYPICAAMVNATYEYSAAYENYTASGISGSQVGDGSAATGTLSSKTLTNGTFDAASFTFSSVASGEDVRGIIVFQSGNAFDGEDYLIAQFDTGSEGAIEISTNGGNITVNWNASGLFSL